MDSERSTYEQLANPLQGIVDRVVDSIILSLSIFVPKLSLLWQFLGYFKGIIGIFLASILLVAVMTVSLVNGAAITGSIGTGQSVLYSGLPPELEGYIFPGFQDTGFPQGSPLGGRGYEWSRRTAGFFDPAYYSYYGRWHNGLDIVPNQRYYKEHETYLLTGKVLVFATCSGFAESKVDDFGALYVIIKCRDGQQVWYAHNSVNYIPEGGTEIRAGQPVAIMGNTGLSDGAHIHYVVRDIVLGSYQFFNPEDYL